MSFKSELILLFFFILFPEQYRKQTRDAKTAGTVEDNKLLGAIFIGNAQKDEDSRYNQTHAKLFQ